MASTWGRQQLAVDTTLVLPLFGASLQRASLPRACAGARRLSLRLFFASGCPKAFFYDAQPESI